MRILIASSLIVLPLASVAASEVPIEKTPPAEADTAARPLPQRERADAWWDDRTAGWIGGIGGSIVGCLGGLIGTLAGLGRARRLTLGLAGATVAFGVACLVAGVVALIMGQPYAVYYPLFLGGGICTLVMGSGLLSMRRRYAEVELRKMAAMDVDSAAN